jgi:hypothetical protein
MSVCCTARPVWLSEPAGALRWGLVSRLVKAVVGAGVLAHRPHGSAAAAPSVAPNARAPSFAPNRNWRKRKWATAAKSHKEFPKKENPTQS